MASGAAATDPGSPRPAAVKPAGRAANDPQRYIEGQLRKTRAHVKAVDIATGLCTLAAATLAFFFVVALIDHWVISGGLGFWGRTLLLVGYLAAASYYFATRVLPLVIRQINPVYAAQTIEQAQPSLKNGLINFLLFRSNRAGVHEAVYQAIEARAAADLRHAPVDSAVDRTRLIHVGYVLMGVVAACCLYKVLSPKDPLQAAGRVILPWADLRPSSRVTIDDVRPGDSTVYRGGRLDVSAEVHGLSDDDRVVLKYTTADGQAVDQAVPMFVPKDGYRHECTIPSADGAIHENLEYRIEAGDASTPKYRVEAIAAPTIVVDRVEYESPAYTGRASRSVDRQGDIKDLEGTKVTIHAVTNQPIKQAWIQFSVAENQPPEKLSMKVDGQHASATYTLALKQGDRSAAEFPDYRLFFRNADNQQNPEPVRHTIEVIPDLSPEVSILAPQQPEVVVPVDGELPIEVRALDPDFALGNVTLLATCRNEQVLSSSLVDGPWQGQFVKSFSFAPRKLQLKEGDIVEYWAVARDTKTPVPNAAETTRQRIRIAPPQSPQKPPPRNQDKQNQDNQPNDQNQNNQGQQGKGQQGKGNQQQGNQGQGNQQGNQGQENQKSQDQGQGGEPKDGANQGKPDQKNDGKGESKGGEAKGSEGKAGQNNQQDKSRDQQQAGAQDKSQDGAKGQEEQSQQAGGKQGDGQQQSKNNSQSGNSDKTNQSNPGNEQKGGGARGDSKSDVKNDSQRGDAQQSGDPAGGGQDQRGADNDNRPLASDGRDDGRAIEEILKDQQQKGGKGTGSQGEQSRTDAPKPGDQNTQGTQQRRETTPNDSGTANSSKPGEQKDGQSGKGQGAQAAGQKSNEQKPDGQQKTGDATGTNADPKQGQRTQGAAKQGEPAPNEGPKDGTPQPGAKRDTANNETSKNDAAKNNSQSPSASQGDPKPGEPGAGQQKSGAKGSPEPQAENRPHNNQQPTSDKPNEREGGAESPSISQKQSTAKGREEGDRSGAGAKGGGQGSKNQGTGGQGQTTASDQGSGQSKESGAGETANQAGGDVKSDRPTGESDSQKGSGSGNRPAPENAKSEPSPDASAQGSSSGQKSDSTNRDTKQGSSGGAGPGDPNNDANSMGGGPADGANGQRPPTGEDTPEDAANLDYARKATDLALEHLRDQMAKDKPSLLEKLGWSADEARSFIERYQKLKQEAAQPGPGGENARQKRDDALRSLGIRPNRTEVGAKGSDDEVRGNRQGPRSRPPADYAEQFEAFTKGRAAAQPPKSSSPQKP